MRTKVLHLLESPAKIENVKLIRKQLDSEFDQFVFAEPIFIKQSKIEKVLVELVLQHLPNKGNGPRRDGLFSVYVRFYDGETQTALGGLKIFRGDADCMQRVLEEAGFEVSLIPNDK